MNDQQKAATVLFQLAEDHFVGSMFHVRLKGDGTWAGGCPWKPGETFNNLPEETKELLKNLKSDDVKKVRWPRR